jgi:hypothetical protein
VRPSSGDASVYVNFVRGTILIRYWISPWMLRSIPSNSVSMRRWTILNCVTLGLWCSVALAVTAPLLFTQAADLFP